MPGGAVLARRPNRCSLRSAARPGSATVHRLAARRPPSEMSAHKVTCGVRLDVLEGVVAEVKADLGEAGVRHRLVVSGSGEWRFVDLVPAEAGKLQVGVAGVHAAGASVAARGRPAAAVDSTARASKPRVPSCTGEGAAVAHAAAAPAAAEVPVPQPTCQALEYARRTLGFLPGQTVACGDSGNDVDMLEGAHRSIGESDSRRACPFLWRPAFPLPPALLHCVERNSCSWATCSGGQRAPGAAGMGRCAAA